MKKNISILCLAIIAVFTGCRSVRYSLSKDYIYIAPAAIPVHLNIITFNSKLPEYNYTQSEFCYDCIHISNEVYRYNVPSLYYEDGLTDDFTEMLADHISRSHVFESVSVNTAEQGWYLRGTLSEFYSRIEVDESIVLEEQMDIYEQTMIYDDDDMRLSRYSFRSLDRYTEIALTNLVLYDSSSNVIWEGVKRLAVTNHVWYDDKDSPPYLANILMREIVNKLCEEWAGLVP